MLDKSFGGYSLGALRRSLAVAASLPSDLSCCPISSSLISRAYRPDPALRSSRNVTHLRALTNHRGKSQTL